MYDANPVDLSYSQSLYAYPVSQSWVVGEGFRFDDPITSEGCSWEYKTSLETKDYWNPAESSDNHKQGGAFYGEVYASQSFEYKTKDVRMDVTPIVNKWLDKTNQNYGFLVRFSGSQETDSEIYGKLKFLSRSVGI